MKISTAGIVKRIRRVFQTRSQSVRQVWILTALVFAGLVTLLISQAAGTTISLQPESQTVGGNMSKIADGSTSAGGYVKFGAAVNQDAHLATLLAATSRNKLNDKSAYVNRSSSGLESDASLYSSAYNGDYGNSSTNPSVTPGEGFGEFRAECDFSHYAYDDPILYPGQPKKAHLHMIFGNTHTNAYSTYNSLLNSGNSTCNGQELNRTAYWVPALIDQDGNPRKPIKIMIYYKSYSITSTNTEFWAPGNNGLQYIKPVAFPPGLQMINNFNSCTATNLTWEQIFFDNQCPTANRVTTLGTNNEELGATDTWTCGIVWDNGAHNGGDYETRNLNSTQIRKCPAPASTDDIPAKTLQQHVVFQYCTNNSTDMANRNYTTIKNDTAWNISKAWTMATCPSTHKYKIPMIEYKISYPIYPGEDTSKWYLSSDINPANGQIKDTTYYRWPTMDFSLWTNKVAVTAKNGATSHGDWFGGWNRTILDKWVAECNSIDGADCVEGIFPVPVGASTKALVKPTRVSQNQSNSYLYKGWYTLRYNNIWKVNGQQLHQEICGAPKLFSVGGAVPPGADIAYCQP